MSGNRTHLTASEHGGVVNDPGKGQHAVKLYRSYCAELNRFLNEQ